MKWRLLLVADVAVGLDGEGAVPGFGGVAGEDLLVELDAQSGGLGDLDVAVLVLERFEDEVAASALAVEAVLENDEVGCGGGEVGANGRRDCAERAVRGNGHVVGLGHGGDLTPLIHRMKPSS